MKDNDWKDRLGVMYSTNPDFQYNTGDTEEEDMIFPIHIHFEVTACF